jgi:psiF repeat
MNFIKLAAAALIVSASATVAFAQATAPAPTAPVAPKAPVAATTPPPSAPVMATAPKAVAKNPAMKTASTPEGIQCSAEADAKALHGKERTKFRNKCIRAAKLASGKTAAPAAKKN